MNSHHRWTHSLYKFGRAIFCLHSIDSARESNRAFAHMAMFIVVLAFFLPQNLKAWTEVNLGANGLNTGMLQFKQLSIFKVNQSNPNTPPNYPIGNEHMGVIPQGAVAKIIKSFTKTVAGQKGYAVQIVLKSTPKKGVQYASVNKPVWIWVDANSSFAQLKIGNVTKNLFETLNASKLSQNVRKPQSPTVSKSMNAANQTRGIVDSTQSGYQKTQVSQTTQVRINSVTNEDGTVNLNALKYCSQQITPEYEQSSECSPRECAKTRPQVTRYNSAKHSAIKQMTIAASDSAGINPALMMSLLDEETIFGDYLKENPWGDKGIAQFQPDTAIATLRYWRSVAPKESPVHKIKGSVQFSHGPKDCGTLETGLVPNINCPEFTIWLMAFHIKQILAGSNDTSVAGLIQDDPVAELRYVTSVYNRGGRILQSYEAAKRQGKNLTAKEYGALWEIPARNGLNGQNINRCYNYRVAGLCGGLGDSLVAQYTQMLCKVRSADSNNNRSVR